MTDNNNKDRGYTDEDMFRAKLMFETFQEVYGVSLWCSQSEHARALIAQAYRDAREAVYADPVRAVAEEFKRVWYESEMISTPELLELIARRAIELGAKLP